MKASPLFLLVGLATLATSCGQDAASKKLADDTEARVVASIKQVLVQGPGQSDFTGQVHTWYQSEVPNIIKLDPGAAKVYQDHAALLREVATTQPKLVQQPILTPDQRFAVETKYRQLVEESTANVQELTNLASSKTTMSEAEQRQFVAGLATKENHQLELVQYYGKRTQAAITQKVQQESDRKYKQRMFGLE
ncbi:MAG: hypothetical protein ACRYG7_06455 [Janthinobacterium lividum]